MTTPRVFHFTYPSDWISFKNPRGAGLNEQTKAWAYQTGLIRPEDVAIERMRARFDVEAYVSQVFPLTRDVDVLRIISDFVLWSTALDDELDEVWPRSDAISRDELCATLMAILEGNDPPEQSRFIVPFRDMVSRIERIVRELRSPPA